MERKKILVVDDNELFRDSIIETLRRQGYEMFAAPNGNSALEILSNVNCDLVISDMRMPGMSGIELLDNVKKIDTNIPFLIITAYGAIDTAVEAMRKGAYDFIQKSENLIRELELTVERTLQFQSLVKENVSLKTALRRHWSYIGNGPKMNEIRELVSTIAESKSTILITGESGTGKELIARAIHYQSKRSNGPFIKVNCAAMPEGLIESELFGHEKGAFTGAIKSKEGKFEAASGGTLLLDEIGEMPIISQAKLLRVLQEKEINKVGGDNPVEVDVRVLATTNRDLEEEVAKGKFREDLFYRLNVIHIHLPPLRERKDDIPQLVEHFVKKFNDDNGFAVTGLDTGALDVLLAHDWPGNIREIENAIERAVVLTRNGLIKSTLFNFKKTGGKDITFANHSGENLEAGMTIEEAEKKLIYKTLDSCKQNRTRAAEMLGISIRTLRNKLNEYENRNGTDESDEE